MNSLKDFPKIYVPQGKVEVMSVDLTDSNECFGNKLFCEECEVLTGEEEEE